MGGNVNYRQLGKTGVAVSEIALGCSGFWGNRMFSEREALKVVHAAFDNGINLFDTGHNYSNYNAEPRLGKAVAEILARHDRAKLVISTKAGTIRPKLVAHLLKTRHTDFSPDYIEKACYDAIRNLNCGYLDIFQLHGIPAQAITDELLSRLVLMKQRGMFRLLGVNTHREADMLHVGSLGEVFDVVLIDLNVLQLDRLPMVRRLHAAGIAVMAGTVLGQGHLAQAKARRLRRPADVWYLTRTLLRPESRRFAKSASGMRNVLGTVPGLTRAQAAMAYVLSIPEICSCVFGTTDVGNLVEVIAASDKHLSAQDKANIQAAYEARLEHLSA
jgi:aryl-alcohol dehydrogenase-like predicted oxidoreductase